MNTASFKAYQQWMLVAVGPSILLCRVTSLFCVGI